MVSEQFPVNTCLKALSDPTRLAIVTRLNSGELSVHEVAEQFPMSRPAISKHLKILREAGLVVERSEGRERIYAIDSGPLRSVHRWLGQFAGAGKSAKGAGMDNGGRKIRKRSQAGQPPSADWRVW